MNAQVTSLLDLQKYSQGVVVELPAFADGQPFVARLTRPSFLSLMAKGKIPNSLKIKANELFQGGGSLLDTDDDSMLADLYEILEIFAESSLVEPTYGQVKEAGVELTDEQMMFIFTYAQKGVEALSSFREEQGSSEPDKGIANL